jgi:hypothetical protein
MSKPRYQSSALGHNGVLRGGGGGLGWKTSPNTYDRLNETSRRNARYRMPEKPRSSTGEVGQQPGGAGPRNAMIHGQRGKDWNADGLGLITTETDFPQADLWTEQFPGLLGIHFSMSVLPWSQQLPQNSS